MLVQIHFFPIHTVIHKLKLFQITRDISIVTHTFFKLIYKDNNIIIQFNSI